MFSLKRNGIITCENCETQTRRRVFDGIRRDVKLGHFISLSVSISQQFPRLTTLYFFSFFNWPLKFDCIFVDNCQVSLNKERPLKAET